MNLPLAPDPVELEGTQGVIVSGGDGAAFGPAGGYVSLRHDGRRCGAVLRRLGDGAPALAMDKYLRIHLHAGSGDEIEVEPASFPRAESVTLLCPRDSRPEGLEHLVRDSLIGKPLSGGQPLPLLFTSLTGDDLVGEVAAISPPEVAIVDAATRLEFEAGDLKRPGVTFDGIGGLGQEIQRLREIVAYPLRNPAAFRRLGIAPPRGVILYGPPGTGKTLISKALAHEVGAQVHLIQGPEIISGWYGGSEGNLRAVFERAKAESPSIVLIDELDSIAPRRDRSRGEVEHRVVATLLTLMDGLSELKDVVVVGTTNRINSIDSALRRPGRFEYEIHIGVPDAAGRREILAIHARRMPLDDSVDLDAVGARAHGFVGADIASLCRQAAYAALRRLDPGARLEEAVDTSEVRVLAEDFDEALRHVRPSATREVLSELPAVGWADVGGLDEIRQILTENVVYGIRRRQSFLDAGIRPAKGILLHGPPGTGKTLLASVLARECGANFIAVRGPEVCSKWFGESEENVRFVFAKAREVAPCIILFDEIDAIVASRDSETARAGRSIVNQLLAEMDGLTENDNLFVIGTTNREKLIDRAMLRPGRFDYQIEVPLPDAAARSKIFAVHLRDKPGGDAVAVDELAAQSDGFSGADIAEVCRLSVLAALRETDFDAGGIELHTGRLQEAITDLRQSQSQKKSHGW